MSFRVIIVSTISKQGIFKVNDILNIQNSNESDNINAQSASLRKLLAAESTAAETNAASSLEWSPAMDQIYQILKYFFKISFKFCPPLPLPRLLALHLTRAQHCRIWQGTVTRMCVNLRKKQIVC